MDIPSDLANTFKDLSKIARERIRMSRPALAIQDKGSGIFDPVTALDREIEQVMRDYLIARYPHHGVWGEEAGWSNENSERHWSIDPIDGTRAFICGLPSWCVLVGFLQDGHHVAGMIDCPQLEDLLVAVDGQTMRNGRTVVTSGCTELAEARLSTTDPYLFDFEEAGMFDSVRRAALLTRYGLDALAYSRVATGDLDLVIESALDRHDLDALVPVVRGAGGFIGDWSGGKDWDSGRIVAAASRALYDEAVAVMSR
jgi:myo-inositol-1(or 4)-monophosphatase